MSQASDKEFPLEKWNHLVQELSEQGKRVVAVGYKKVSVDINEVTHDLMNDGI